VARIALLAVVSLASVTVGLLPALLTRQIRPGYVSRGRTAKA
jgi:hypothetical protein